MVTDVRKTNQGKLEYSLFPNSVLVDIIKVMMHGNAGKYKKNSWKNCQDIDLYYDAHRRHVEAYREGEYYDVESGLPHLTHALCNLVFMHWLEEQKQKGKNNESP